MISADLVMGVLVLPVFQRIIVANVLRSAAIVEFEARKVIEHIFTIKYTALKCVEENETYGASVPVSRSHAHVALSSCVISSAKVCKMVNVCQYAR